MIGSAKLAAAMLGTSTIANGFAVTPTGPASLQVVVAPGEIYAMANIDSLAFSTLPADTTHSILKQGILLDGVTLSCPAPTTTGQSINYLVQVTYQDQDSTPVLLPYYNSANPALPYSGMGNNGLTQNTARKGVAIVQVKAGASAATGSQVTPAPDSGYIGLYVATVAYGQTTITSGNIAQYPSAPLLPSGVLQSIQGGNTTYALDTGTTNACAAAFLPAILSVQDGLVLRFKSASTNTGPTTFSPNGISPAPIVGALHLALQGGEISAGGSVWVQWSNSVGGGSWILLDSTGGSLQVAPAGKSLQAVNAGQIQLQSVTAFTAGGTSGAQTLTPAPAITGYVAGHRFRIKFSASSTGSDTLSVSGLATKNLKQYDYTGAKIPAVFSANQLADIEYDGTDFVVIDQLPAIPINIQGAFKNLVSSATGLSSVVSVSADELVLESNLNTYQTLRGVSVSPSFANSGANGLDIGAANSQAASTFYSVWVIWNGTTTAGLLSQSATSPTMPSGYTHKARTGWVRTDATGNKYPLSFTQQGRSCQYKVAGGSNVTSLPIVANGSQGTVGSVGVLVLSSAISIPATAAKVKLSLFVSGNSTIQVSPNSNMSLAASSPAITVSTSTTTLSLMAELTLESSGIYYAGNASSVNCTASLYGWEDNL